MKFHNYYSIFWGVVLFFASCKPSPNTSTMVEVIEDTHAKQLLQGIWVNDIEEDVVFKIHGDTIYYPDSTNIPVAFKIIDDTLMLGNKELVKYNIIKQTEHLFVFKNQYGDKISLVKSENADDNFAFQKKQPVVLNQKQLIKRDTIIERNKERYHLYMQVNPTSYKIIKNTYTDEGVEVGNIYYDNIVHVSVFQEGNRLFSRDFRKSDFQQQLPAQFYKQCLLSDIVFVKLTNSSAVFKASLPIPDTTTSYVVTITITFDGKFFLNI